MARPQWRVPDVRLALVGLLFVAAWIGIGVRLVDVQALNADAYAEQGLDQRLKHEELAAARGTIFDRDGVELAVSVGSVTIFADPAFVSDAEVTARLLAPLLGIAEADLVAKLTADTRFTYIVRRMTRDEAGRVREVVESAGLTGIFFDDEPDRVYPAGSLAAQLIGFVRNDDLEGIEGLEFRYNELLEGRPGSQIVERDPYRNPIPQGQYIVEPPVHGSDLVLTIDREIQFTVEQAAGHRGGQDRCSRWIRRCPRRGDRRDSRHGKLSDIRPQPIAPTRTWGRFGNRAVADMYEPGSTLKVVTIAAALEEGIVGPQTRLTLPARFVVKLDADPKVYTDVARNREEEFTVADIVSRSSNIGTIMIQAMLGNEVHHRYLASFGLGKRASGELPGEAPGSSPAGGRLVRHDLRAVDRDRLPRRCDRPPDGSRIRRDRQRRGMGRTARHPRDYPRRRHT